MKYTDKLRRHLNTILSIAQGNERIKDDPAVKNMARIASLALELHNTDSSSCWCNPKVEASKKKPSIANLTLIFLFLLSLLAQAHAQELNLGVRDVFPRDSWTQGALLVGRPENFEIARTVLTATVPIGVQDFVVESTEGIPNGLQALIYDPADPTGRPIDGFDVYVTGPYTLHTNKINRYQFEPGYIVQLAANVDPNGAILQGVGPGGTLRKVIIKGREELREEIYFDARGKLRGTRWRKIK